MGSRLQSVDRGFSMLVSMVRGVHGEQRMTALLTYAISTMNFRLWKSIKLMLVAHMVFVFTNEKSIWCSAKK